ncbi:MULTISPECIES: bifunctional DNA primase/polymerase [Streptomyces]|uniref:bifunctional DNA primase/polymerase n=1 Tax=Streptomyces TaxID=1883 RepID=UPI0029BE109E|nr:bifunctional DNA primase/polymerase [Streptomyces scabiei]MDX2538614.1 bifunctional DNA primase/polymerase [Streptomyces scabiei]MDX2799888.1 bifunctional DNA primase/polymerase [Streptomyces scabiei]MDX2858171.1 bifunctional DNA primase/polymerase [Streptomyces scabiei]MDX3277866.1 bifunctional DNA primase/polymerase [Streptomyces scabiei]MDX3828543.1 bifunctional DNA primase/polymerase [Streptomyces scabiei]
MNDAQHQDLRASAREMHDAGLCVLKIKADGNKKPGYSWMQYKVTRSTPAEHDEWFGGGRPHGIAAVYGAVSGNVELLEVEGHAVRDGILDELNEIMEASGLGEPWRAILNGWASESPSGGRHYRARIEGADVPGNTKLASRLAREDEYTDEERQRLREKPNSKIIRVQVETRGEGGYGIVEPSAGTVHPSGKPYVRLAGGPANIPTIDADTMAAIRDVCRMLDTLPSEEKAKTAPRPKRELPAGVVRPGDDFENKVDWPDIIGDEFDPIFTRGSTTYWRRKGKNRGISATTGHAKDRDRLFVFSTSTVFEAEVPYDKFAAYTLLTQGGTNAAAFKRAAAELGNRGFGSGPRRTHVSLVPPSAGPFTDGSSALDPDHAPDEHETFEGGPDLRVVTSKPQLDVTNEADALDGTLGLMADGRLPGLYKRSGGPTWVHQDDNGNPLMQQLGADNLRAYLAEHVDTYQVVADPLTEGTKAVRELMMPKTCGTILGRKDWPLPPLRGIVTSPVIRQDGTLLQAPGYDKVTGLYLQPRVPLRRLQPQVTEQSLARAKEIVLDQMLADFPWAQPSDRAHFLGALLTPILRPYFYGPTPMFLLTATAPSSGKSLLKDILKYAFGIAETAWPENDTELRKSITTQLYTTGQPVVVLDNLPNGFIVKSPVLSSLLTAEHWGDRVLGSTASVTMPNDRLWILTGNGLRTGGDNGRRAMWVRLDPNCPDPDQRDGFRVGDLRPWLRANASTVVAAAVTMVRAWLADGAKTVRVRKGDYSEWASMMAGLLKYLGVEGWMADRGQNAGQDEEEQEWAAFLAAWHRKLGDEAVAAGAVIAAVPEQVPRLKNGELPSSQGLGGWLKSREGRYFSAPELDNYKPVKVWDSHRCQNLWRVEVHQSRNATGSGR